MPGESPSNTGGHEYLSLSNSWTTELVGRCSNTNSNTSGNTFKVFADIFGRDPGDPDPHSTYIADIVEIVSTLTPVIVPVTGNMIGMITNVN
jgi:hypothetical protein